MHLRDVTVPARKPAPIMDWFMKDMFKGILGPIDACGGTLNVSAHIWLTYPLLIAVCEGPHTDDDLHVIRIQSHWHRPVHLLGD